MGPYGPKMTKADVRELKQFLRDTNFLSITMNLRY